MRTMCPEDLLLLLSIALIGASPVTTSLIIYGLYGNSQAFPSPHWAVLLVLITVIDFFQALLMEQISDSTPILRKNLGV